jgi:phosphoribosylformimino-5-aminoimidazole carboxamide ribonucleotide (ProFAR) isomerase
VRRVAEAGAAGVVIGRALYDGRIGLREAIAAARGTGKKDDRPDA